MKVDAGVGGPFSHLQTSWMRLREVFLIRTEGQKYRKGQVLSRVPRLKSSVNENKSVVGVVEFLQFTIRCYRASQECNIPQMVLGFSVLVKGPTYDKISLFTSRLTLNCSCH